MYVVCHQTIGKDSDIQQYFFIAEIINVVQVICFTSKYWLAIVSPLNNMQRITREKKTRISRHLSI